MYKKKQIDLNLFRFKFPVTAIVSILHRVSGVILFSFIPVFLYCLDRSLKNEQSFFELSFYLNLSFFKFIILFITMSLVYHLIAGIRHMILDMGFFESKLAASISSYIVLVISLVIMVCLGMKLW